MNYPKLITWLLKQIDEDLLWAREASQENDTFAEKGAHWQWENARTDEVLTPDPGLKTQVGAPHTFCVSLRSRETWLTESGGTLPQFAIPYAEEISSAVGGHIIRHDPARVIRDLTARRRSVLACSENLGLALADAMLRDMAVTYAERPGYLREWAPSGY